MELGLPQVDKNKVVVLTITYNQSKYIEDTLNGFAMQRTNFSYICCVFDDASTDGEQDVLKQWINCHCNRDKYEMYDHPLTIILMAPDRYNPNCIYAIHLLKKNLFGKPEKKQLIDYWTQCADYIAMCEGDDYWIDPLKLQKQVNFLDANPEYSYSCHRYNILEENTGNLATCPNKYFDKHSEKQFFTFDIEYTFTQDWISKTLTAIFRSSTYLDRDCENYKYRRDVHLIYELLSKGKGVCHSFIGGVYRRNDNSIYNSLDIIRKKKIDYKVYKEFYEVNRNPLFKHIATRIYYDLMLKHKTIIKVDNISELVMIIQGSWNIAFNKIKSKLFNL